MCFSRLCSGGEVLAPRGPCPTGSRGRWAELAAGWEAVLCYPKLLHPLCRVLSPQPCSPHCSQNMPPTSLVPSPALLAGASLLPPGTPAPILLSPSPPSTEHCNQVLVCFLSPDPVLWDFRNLVTAVSLNPKVVPGDCRLVCCVHIMCTQGWKASCLQACLLQNRLCRHRTAGCFVPSCLQGWLCEEAKGAAPASPEVSVAELQGVTLTLDAAENRRVWSLLLTFLAFLRSQSQTRRQENLVQDRG